MLGHVVKGVESIIVSHTLDEGKMFVPSDTSDAAFEKVLRYFWGSSNSSIDAIKKQYLVSKFPSEKERFRAFLNWSTFLCATRYIPDAYKNKTYNMVYSQGAAVHGSDIGTTFYDATGVMGMATKLFNPKYADLAPKYQAYLTSHARSGDPNTFKAGGTVEWPKVSLGGTFGNVLNVTDNGFALISDPANKEEDCAFWTKIMEQFKN
jgi:carboxylesterase type B